MSLDKIKILVIDDSPFMRKIITDILDEDPSMVVLAQARNGKEGLHLIEELKPDVITLDIEMPILNGIDTLKLIMERFPTPVVMISNLTKEGAEETLVALECGAVDFIAKPHNIFATKEKDTAEKIIEVVKSAATLKSNRKLSILTTPPAMVEVKEVQRVKKTIQEKNHKNESPSSLSHIVTIGVSTGGPKALQDVIPSIPEDFSAPILIVQHMPPGFTKSLAERLNNLSKITVKEACDGDIIKAGYAYIAPGDFHMTVEKSDSGQYFIKLSDMPPEGGHRPSVNTLLRSVDANVDIPIVGVIMTGMGSDGCQGYKLLKQNKKINIIAQNEETCVVYGMPKAVVEAGIADVITDLDCIAHHITMMLGGL